jgi:hypothetical protein
MADTPTLTPEDIEALRGALEGGDEDRMIQVRADVLRSLLPVSDAITTRGHRNPNSLTGKGPVTAYNIGWSEGRASMALSAEAINMDEALTDQEHEVYGGAFTEPDMRTTTEKEADDNAAEYRASHADEPYEESEDKPLSEQITQAEEPVEDRLQRAFCNGFIEGVRRGSYGRWDHS